MKIFSHCLSSNLFIWLWPYRMKNVNFKLLVAWKPLQVIMVLKGRLCTCIDWLISNRTVFFRSFAINLASCSTLYLKFSWILARSIVKGYLIQTRYRCTKNRIFTVVLLLLELEAVGCYLQLWFYLPRNDLSPSYFLFSYLSGFYHSDPFILIC